MFLEVKFSLTRIIYKLTWISVTFPPFVELYLNIKTFWFQKEISMFSLLQIDFKKMFWEISFTFTVISDI